MALSDAAEEMDMSTTPDPRTTPLPWRIVSEPDDAYRLAIVGTAPDVGIPIHGCNSLGDARLIVRRVNAGPAADALAEAVGQRTDVLVDDLDGDWEKCQHDHISREEAPEKGVADDWLCDNCGAAFAPFADAGPLRVALEAYRKASEEPR